MPEKLFDRALVVRGGALGDFLLTLPVLRALREASGRLELLAYPQFAELARRAGLADEAKSIEYGALAGFFARGAVLEPRLRDYFSSFDLVLSYLYDPDGIFRENLRSAGVKNFTAGPHKPGAQKHAIDQLAAPLAALRVDIPERAVRLHLPDAEPHAELIALHPGSGSSAKNWPSSHWKDLAEELLATSPQICVAIVGGEADRPAIDALQGLRHNDRVEFWENLPLAILAGKLAGARGYVGHDTGISHLAAALGVPSVLLFGPTDPSVWAPPHCQARVLHAPDGELERLGLSSVLAAARAHLPPLLLASHD